MTAAGSGLGQAVAVEWVNDAAQQILIAVLQNQRVLLMGVDAKSIDVLQRILPQAYQKLFVTATARQA